MEEMKRQATEKLSKTRKRKDSLEDLDVDDKISPSKRKKSTSLADVVQQTIQLKKMALETQQQQMIQRSLLQQQHQFQQQQQALNMSMMSVLSELLKVKK